MSEPKYPYAAPRSRIGDIIQSEQTKRCYRVVAVGRDGIYELVDVLSRARYIEAIAYADAHWTAVEEDAA